MNDREAIEEVLTDIKQRRAAIAPDREALDARSKLWRAEHDAAIDLKLELYSDAEIMADEQLLRWLLKASWAHDGAGKRKHVLTKPAVPELRDEYVDGRDGWAEDVLPALQLSLVKDQEVKDVADALRAWVKTWALGRPDLHVSIMERTLSRHCSYALNYYPATDTAALETHPSYRLRENLSELPLEELLAVVARDYWYRKPGAEGSWDSDDDE